MKLNINLLYDREIPFLYIVTKTWMQVFIKSLLLIEKKTQCLSIDKQIHIIGYNSTPKRKKATDIYNNLDEFQICMLNEKKETKDCILYDSIYIKF